MSYAMQLGDMLSRIFPIALLSFTVITLQPLPICVMDMHDEIVAVHNAVVCYVFGILKPGL